MSNGRVPTYGGSAPFVYPTNDRRASYNEVLKQYEQYFDSNGVSDKIAILPAEIRSEVVPAGTVNNIAFSIRSDQPNQGMTNIRSTENRLDINDAFWVQEIGLLFGMEVTATPDDGAMILQQWENPYPFTGVGLGGGFTTTGAPTIAACYNGTFDMEINTIKWMDKFGALRFKWVEDAQSGLGVSAVATVGIQAGNGFGDGKGFVEMIPQPHVAGNDKVKFQLNLPKPFTFTVGANRIVAAMILRGLKVQNGATFRPGR